MTVPFCLPKDGLITIPEALENATNPESLMMALRGISAQGSTNDPARRGSQPKPAHAAPSGNDGSSVGGGEHRR